MIWDMLANLFHYFLFFSLFQVAPSQMIESTLVRVEPWAELVTAPMNLEDELMK